MQYLISIYQLAFVSNRWISKNTLIAQQIVYTMNKKRENGDLMGMKIDMNKVYY